MPTAINLNLCLWKLPVIAISRLFTFSLLPCHFISSVFLLLIATTAPAQEYSYVHYDVKDGLASSTVYDLCQDNDGFIWFATDAGVSRFDGTNFKNFTTADGLPDNEVIKIFADSRGRIWMAPFKNTICYYYEGKIYNQENDSLLKKIKLQNAVIDIQEDDDKNIGLQTHNNAIIISATNNDNPLTKLANTWVFNDPYSSGFMHILDDSAFSINNSKKKLLYLIPNSKKYTVAILPGYSIKYIDGPSNFTSAYRNQQGNKIIFLNSFNGAWMVDTVSSDRFEEVFLPDKKISRSLIDNENNYWFCTLGEGVYKLVSREFKTYRFNLNKPVEIFSIYKNNNVLLAGAGDSKMLTISGSKTDSLIFRHHLAESPYPNSYNRIVCITKNQNNNIILGMDGSLVSYNPVTGKEQVAYTEPVKSVEYVDTSSILVSTGRGTYLLNNNLAIKDTLWNHRTTAACFYNNAYYVGTLEGLYVKTLSGSVSFKGDAFPPFRYRISRFIKSPEGKLWIATHGNGLVCLKGDSILCHLTVKDGLTSDVCRTMFLQNNTLWAGTDKGLNKISLDKNNYPVTRYTTADGLPSNIINAVYADSNIVYVGSPGGLTFFDESKISSHSTCNLKILEVSIANVPQPFQNNYQVHYKDNSLKFTYAGISFKSEGDIVYRYRLKGLTDTWDSTRQTTLEYPSLPPGDYELELMAVNKFGKSSNPQCISFSVIAPFWQTSWFRLLIFISTIAITWLLVARRFQVLRKREQEKSMFYQKMNDLEQMALRSQMNPHFIFNCLNSIQNFIINNNLEASNEYLTGFAALIRQTLDNSEKTAISVSNEIRYLSRYLELEKMRFGHSFDYHIEAAAGLDSDNMFIPPMILQPYVENSIRHGLRYKKNGDRLVSIKFVQNNNGLLCIVQDNGIGRMKAHDLKSRIHLEYQSKGMSVTEERINILNRQFKDPVTIEITDLEDDRQQPAGTRISIHFSHSSLTQLKRKQHDPDNHY